MTRMSVATHGDFMLVYDTDDVEHCSFSTPHDVHDLPPTATGWARRGLGQAHLTLRVDFKPGKRAMWVRSEDAQDG